MSSRTIPFFRPGVLVGAQTIHTPFVNVADIDVLGVTLRVPGYVTAGATTLDVTIQHATRPNPEDAESLGAAFPTFSTEGIAERVYSVRDDKMMSFVRAKIVVYADVASNAFTLEVTGTGRSVKT